MTRIFYRIAAMALATVGLAACETLGDAASSTSEALGSWYQSAKSAVKGSDGEGGDGKSADGEGAVNPGTPEQSYFARQIADLAEPDAMALGQEGARALDQGQAGKAVEWQSPETGTRVVFVPGDTVLEERKLRTVLKEGVAQPADLEIIGSTYQSQRNANVRTAPGIENPVVDHLKSGERFQAVGRTRSLAWILVAKEGQVVGYVYEPLVIPAPSAGPLPQIRDAVVAPASENASPMLATIIATTPCRNLSYDVVTVDGQRSRAELRACKSGDGAWEIN